MYNHFIWILAPLSPMNTDNNLDCWHFVMRSFVATTFTGKGVLTLKEFSCNYEKLGKCSLQYLVVSYPKSTFCHDQILQQKLYETAFWRLFRKWKGLFQFFFFFYRFVASDSAKTSEHISWVETVFISHLSFQ